MGGDLKCCAPENFLAPPGFFAAPPDQKSWLRLLLNADLNCVAITVNSPVFLIMNMPMGKYDRSQGFVDIDWGKYAEANFYSP